MPAPVKDLTHTHRCDCGNFLTCRQPPDQCAVADPYLCPTCLQNELDHYITATYCESEHPSNSTGDDHERF